MMRLPRSSKPGITSLREMILASHHIYHNQSIAEFGGTGLKQVWWNLQSSSSRTIFSVSRRFAGSWRGGL